MSRWSLDTHTFISRGGRWGLSLAQRDNLAATRVERRWRWPTLLALLLTIPAFYAELLHREAGALASGAYALAGLVLAAGLGQVALRSRHAASHLKGNPTELLLIAGLLVSALAPSSLSAPWALTLRMVVALATLLRMVWAIQHLITRGGLAYMVVSAVVLLLACGVGYWWLEPSTPTLADGLWLAFTTAATVGYGDIVPTTPASRIFSVFVVMLGFGVLSLITAAIAAAWVETEERRIEREILHDMRREMAGLRQELAALRDEIAAAPRATSERQAVRLDVQQPVEDQ